MSNEEHEIEVEGIFRMLNAANTSELDIHQMNMLGQKLDSFGVREETPKQREVIKPVNLSAASSPKQASGVRAMTFTELSGLQRKVKERVMKRTENGVGRREVAKHATLTYVNAQQIDLFADSKSEAPKKKNPSFEAYCFPNRKKTINLDEFSTICQNDLANNQIKDEILLKCFSILDVNQKGYINASSIKEMFTIFNEDITEEDTDNLLRFIGCNNEIMTFEEFKLFFYKNL